MLLAWPRGVVLRGTGRARPVVTLLVLLAALVLRVASALAPVLPGSLAALGSAGAWARLYSDPAMELFAPWQLWTWPLVHDSWWGLAVAGVGWWVFAGSLERRLGPALFVLGLVVFAPLAVALHLLAGMAVPDLGLVPVTTACAGALFGLAPRAIVTWDCWWWMVVAVGHRRFAMPTTWLLGAILAVEVLRLSGLQGQGLGTVSATFLPLHAIQLVVALLAGHSLGRSLGGLRDQALLAPLLRCAAGEGSLDEVDELLELADGATLAQLEAVGERALREGHREAAAAILAVLARRAPEGGTARRLRAMLAGTGPD